MVLKIREVGEPILERQCDEVEIWFKKFFVEKLQNDNKFFTIKFEYAGEKLIKYDLKEY